MFIEIVQKERLQIFPTYKDINKIVLSNLQQVVPGRQIEGIGISLFPLSIESITDAKIHEGFLYPLVAYKLVVYKACLGEIITCTVEKQDTTGIFLTHPLLPSIFVPASQMPSSSELTAVAGRMSTVVNIWGWKYNECVLYIRMGEVCKVSVINIACSMIYASIDGSGLGPVSWW